MKTYPQVTRLGLLLAPLLAVILCSISTFWLGKQITTAGAATPGISTIPPPRPTATAPTATATATHTPTSTPTPTLTPMPTPTAFVKPKPIRDLGRLVTADQEFQVWLTYEDRPNWWPFPFWNNKIILFTEGSVQAGVDLDKLDDKDLVVRGTKIEIILPPPEFFGEPNLDPDKTVALEGSSFNPFSMDWNDAFQAQREAEEAIRQKARETGLLEKARENAELRLEILFRRLGATDVTIRWRDISS